jgi:hypothetical protein
MGWLWATYFIVDGAWPEDNYYTPVTGTNLIGQSNGQPDPEKPAHYNPFISDLNLPMPTSVQHLCTAPGISGTDQLTCWGNADADGVPQEESIRLAGYNCENTCGQTEQPSPDFDYLFTIPTFVKRKQQFDYCCKGKLQPDWEALKARTLAMSAAENVRPPECREYGGDFDLARNPNPEYKRVRSCFMNHLGMSCEACCYNPDAHPVQWTSNYKDKVKENYCWNSDVFEATLGHYATALTPFDKWQKCCQDSGCDPAVHVWVCLALPWVPMMALTFFLTVVGACAIFEWALIGNKLCFKNPPQDDDPFATMNKNQEAIAEERRKSDVAAQRKSSKGGESSSGIPDKKPSIKPSAVAPATVPPMPGAGAGALE